MTQDDIKTVQNVDPDLPFTNNGSSLIWNIPQRYTVDNGANWIIFATVQAKYEIDATGKATVQKAGVGPFSKNLDDPTTSY